MIVFDGLVVGGFNVVAINDFVGEESQHYFSKRVTIEAIILLDGFSWINYLIRIIVTKNYSVGGENSIVELDNHNMVKISLFGVSRYYLLILSLPNS